MPVRVVDSPAGPLYRVGRAPDPWEWPPLSIARMVTNRYDDPLGRVRVLYAAERRPCAFLETLARFRTPLDVLAALNALPAGDPAFVDAAVDVNRVPDDWHLKRRLGTLRVEPGHRWLDVRQPETQATLRTTLADVFARLGLTDFDLSDVLGRDRRVTQAIAEWAIGEAFAGIVYESRLNRDCTCWTIYEGTSFAVTAIAAISRTDPDLVTAAGELHLRL